MWIASKFGFFSIVRKNPGKCHVRARMREDLENLIAASGIEAEILTWDESDYRHRVIVEESVVEKIMATLAETLDYDNFKNKMARTTPDDAARKIYSDLAKNKGRCLIGTDAKLISLISRLMPVNYWRVLGKLT